MDFPVLARLDRACLIDRVTEHVHDATQRTHTDRHGDRLAGVVGDQVALEAVSGTQRDRAHDAIAELLLDFQRDRRVLDFQCVVDARHGLAREFDVDDCADDLNDLALTHVCFLKKIET